MQIITTALMGLLLFPGAMFHRPMPVQTSIKPQTSIADAVDIPLSNFSTKTLTVKSTAYNAVPDQTDNTPFITASGAYSNSQVIAARSGDLAKKLPFGTIISLEKPKRQYGCGYSAVKNQIGYRVIADTMNISKHNQIDILFNRENKVRIQNTYKNPSIVFGVCKQITIRIVGHVFIRNIPHTQAKLAAYVIAHTEVQYSVMPVSGDVAFR